MPAARWSSRFTIRVRVSRAKTSTRCSKSFNGWISNRPDGAVEAVFEGEPDRVNELVEFCRHGPSRAEVANVEVIDEEPEGLSGFEVR